MNRRNGFFTTTHHIWEVGNKRISREGGTEWFIARGGNSPIYHNTSTLRQHYTDTIRLVMLMMCNRVIYAVTTSAKSLDPFDSLPVPTKSAK